MSIRLISIGIISSSLLIFIQLIAGLIELFHYDNYVTDLIVNLTNMILNILMFAIMWKVLVKYYGQDQFDWLIKSMITLMILITILSTIIMLKITKIILLFIAGLSLVNLILSFVFLSRIMDIERFEVKWIEYLKNYSVAFIFCLIGQFVLAALLEFKNMDLKFLNHLLSMIPILFIVLFFDKIKDDII